LRAWSARSGERVVSTHVARVADGLGHDENHGRKPAFSGNGRRGGFVNRSYGVTLTGAGRRSIARLRKLDSGFPDRLLDAAWPVGYPMYRTNVPDRRCHARRTASFGEGFDGIGGNYHLKRANTCAPLSGAPRTDRCDPRSVQPILMRERRPIERLPQQLPVR
jgi:hypothetical protein